MQRAYDAYLNDILESIRKIEKYTENMSYGDFREDELKKREFMNHKFHVVLEKDECGYYAYSPELEGCQTQGDTLEEVMANIKEAIELYFETLPQDERTAYLSKEILTTSLEVQVAC